MITCPICDYHYSEKRTHCPTCGTIPEVRVTIESTITNHSWNVPIALAIGFERARQLPQSPRFFQLVD